ncbi:MAG: DUF805 domain-containing protein [Terracidiphilus sp.]|jgi:uncharacterized membrane protein YhaH (DUF805 family)
MATSFLSYRGRLNRGKYWGFSLVAAILIAAWFAIIAQLQNLTGSENENVEAAFGFAGMVGMFAFWSFPRVKRFHDLNMPGWYFWLMFIPFLNIYLEFLLCFEAGEYGPNKYGDDVMPYRANIQRTLTGVVFHTPPRWDSWRRYVALVIALLGFVLCCQLSFIQIRDSVSSGGFSFFDLLLLWPLILVWIGWFNFIGMWGFANRVVVENGKATFHLLGPFGKEKEPVTMDSIKAFKSGGVVGIVNGREKECFLKRKYLSPELRNALTALS